MDSEWFCHTNTALSLSLRKPIESKSPVALPASQNLQAEDGLATNLNQPQTTQKDLAS